MARDIPVRSLDVKSSAGGQTASGERKPLRSMEATWIVHLLTRDVVGERPTERLAGAMESGLRGWP